MYELSENQEPVPPIRFEVTYLGDESCKVHILELPLPAGASPSSYKTFRILPPGGDAHASRHSALEMQIHLLNGII